MRLPHQLQASPWFLFSEASELLAALGVSVGLAEIDEIKFLSKRRLPPVTSRNALSVMIGVNPGLVWSFVNRPRKHYRVFKIPKGTGVRHIAAPRVGLKIIQKWLSFHFARAVLAPSHVFGFVPGKSYVEAAFLHRNAEWAFSVDIEDFFSSTPAAVVIDAFQNLGYSTGAAHLLSALTCLDGYLAQGAPTSPSLSNLCFRSVDERLKQVAARHNCELSRYADDITMSGCGTFPDSLRLELHDIFSSGPWRLSKSKEKLHPIRGRIKIHGLLVNDGRVRLTKGYRNKIRAYNYILATRGEQADNALVLKGHVSYSRHVARMLQNLSSDQQSD